MKNPKMLNQVKPVETVVVSTLPTQVDDKDVPAGAVGRNVRVVYDVDAMPQSDRIVLEKRFKAARLRIEAEMECLKSLAFSSFDAELNETQLDTIMAACTAAKRVLTKAA